MDIKAVDKIVSRLLFILNDDGLATLTAIITKDGEQRGRR